MQRTAEHLLTIDRVYGDVSVSFVVVEEQLPSVRLHRDRDRRRRVGRDVENANTGLDLQSLLQAFVSTNLTVTELFIPSRLSISVVICSLLENFYHLIVRQIRVGGQPKGYNTRSCRRSH